ncbi:Metallo-dependent phosphatase [Dothidotthia symphoricarpi CBS 119687]|uniref:Metallo-dependent phosphatase n=1 Tax=Dothidotthia symphoricarpi CBS 119687 TaxID=1392245 RepID=A0A6A6A1P3_9PLEO|nr:Metallo-dependent phosphatase [Dothidotthia symphoricarpi CBS 119687]KAF2125922.1 Metallo-dependent phosphatase [Dothidotthia symphoricarpi CBS 119687]
MTPLKKIRIVCISDTHNTTPKLPAGDILIHAGDLTNQGSYAELERSVAWLSGCAFEARVVVCGNHDIPLDAPFHARAAGGWKWPSPQNPQACRNLLLNARGITYLEHSSTTIHLSSGVRVKIFGSPYSPLAPGGREWAFQYDDSDAAQLWDAMPGDADVVVTHTPARGFVDGGRGCGGLGRRLGVVRPWLGVCGHVHGGRGVERVFWDGLQVERWRDPGEGNGRLSVVDATRRRGGEWVRVSARRGSGEAEEEEVLQPGATMAMTTADADVVEMESLADGALGQSEALRILRHTNGVERELGCERRETVMVNAAVLGPRVGGKTGGFQKPIVVDVELPVVGTPPHRKPGQHARQHARHRPDCHDAR